MRISPAARGRLAAAGALLLFLAAPAIAQDDWRLPGLSGGALTREDVSRGTTVILVWAAWSPRCEDIVERANGLVARWGDRARVVLVNFQEDPGAVNGFLAGKGGQAPVYLDADGSFAKRHQVTTLPGLVVYRDGAVAYQGRLPLEADDLLADLVE